MAGVRLVDAAAKLRCPTAVEVIENSLSNELSIQPHSEIHRQAVFKVPLGDFIKAPLLHRASQAAHVVIAPEGVPLCVQDESVRGGDVLLPQRRQCQPGGLQLRDGLHMAHQLILDLHLVLAGKLCRAVLELGGPKPPVRRVVLPVDQGSPVAEHGGKLLDQRGVHSGIGIEGLFNMDDQGLAALLCQGQGNELLPHEHAAADKVGAVQHFQHLLSPAQLVAGHFVVRLHKLLLVVLPEGLDGGGVLRAQPPELRLRPLGAELLDVVALAGVPPPRKKLQVLAVVHVVPPGAVVADADVRIAGKEMADLGLGNDRVVEGHALDRAPALDGVQSLVHISLRAGDGIVEAVLPRSAAADHETPVGLRPVGIQRLTPHKAGAHGIFAKAVIAVFIVAAQEGCIPLGDGFEV